MGDLRKIKLHTHHASNEHTNLPYVGLARYLHVVDFVL
jgi:uncharacterized protein (DUF427 family)